MGKIKRKLLENEFEKIQTEETIVTEERLKHIMEHHPNDFDLFIKYGKEILQNPDLVLKDVKNEGTIFMIRRLKDTNLNMVVRVVLETDNPERKNSVMTFYRIRNKNLEKLMIKNIFLYSKE